MLRLNCIYMHGIWSIVTNGDEKITRKINKLVLYPRSGFVTATILIYLFIWRCFYMLKYVNWWRNTCAPMSRCVRWICVSNNNKSLGYDFGVRFAQKCSKNNHDVIASDRWYISRNANKGSHKMEYAEKKMNWMRATDFGFALSSSDAHMTFACALKC